MVFDLVLDFDLVTMIPECMHHHTYSCGLIFCVWLAKGRTDLARLDSLQVFHQKSRSDVGDDLDWTRAGLV